MNIVFRCDPALADLLPRPIAAKAALPSWLRQMEARMPSLVHQRSIRTVKQCPPFVDAMTHGFVILLPCDVVVCDGRFSWDWPLPELGVSGHPRAPLSFHVPEQVMGSPLERGETSVLKFNSFWTIELDPGWSLMVVHPVNRDDLPFRLVTGMIDADRFNDIGINFPAVWIDSNFNGVLARGTPIAQCYPVPRQTPTLVFEVMSEIRQRQYEELSQKIMDGSGVYRRQHRSKRGIS